MDPVTERSVLYGRRTTALTWALEHKAWGIARFTRFWDSNYYRTYVEERGQRWGYMSVQQEVTRALADPADFADVEKGSPDWRRKTSGRARDTSATSAPPSSCATARTCRRAGRATRTPSPGPSRPSWPSAPDGQPSPSTRSNDAGGISCLEVEIFRFTPAGLPLGAVTLPLTPEETLPPDRAGDMEEHPQHEEVGQLRARAVGAIEDDHGRGTDMDRCSQPPVVDVPVVGMPPRRLAPSELRQEQRAGGASR